MRITQKQLREIVIKEISAYEREMEEEEEEHLSGAIEKREVEEVLKRLHSEAWDKYFDEKEGIEENKNKFLQGYQKAIKDTLEGLLGYLF